MKHPSAIPTSPVATPAAAPGQTASPAQIGPQPQPDPWTIRGASVYYAHSIVVGNPTGGPMGDGTVNAQEFYVNGVQHDPALFARIAGVTFTGPVVLKADPTVALGAATKQYVDNHIAAIPPLLVAGDTPPVNPTPGLLWWSSTAGQLFIWYVDPNSSQWVVCNNALNSISLDMGSY